MSPKFSIFFSCVVLLTGLLPNSTIAQEFEATVIVNTDQLASTSNQSYVDKTIINDMQNNLSTFINTTKWTNHNFQQNERIKLNIIIGLTDAVSLTRFKANVQVTTARPIYGSSYESNLFSFIDKDWEFEYVQSQPLIFNENAFTSNLTSLIAYYLYLCLGMDYDSFSMLGGTIYFDKAFQILNNASSSNEKGWRANDGFNARYWLIENLQSPQLKAFRESVYIYHRKALDLMAENQEEPVKKIFSVLEELKKVNMVKPGTLIMRSFFNTKDRELVGIFSKAPQDTKQKAFDILRELDPTNTDKYQDILKN
ncbi:MAG: DUF4835 family protein [Cytophagales bacterium]